MIPYGKHHIDEEDIKSVIEVLKSKYIIVCIGTPINKQLNPSLRSFINFFYQLKKFLKKNQIVIIRSSIYPGICDKIYKIPIFGTVECLNVSVATGIVLYELSKFFKKE